VTAVSAAGKPHTVTCVGPHQGTRSILPAATMYFLPTKARCRLNTNSVVPRRMHTVTIIPTVQNSLYQYLHFHGIFCSVGW